MDDDSDFDTEYETEAPAWAWDWWCVPVGISLGIRSAVNSIVEDAMAAYNFRRIQRDFRASAAREIETLIKES